MAKKKIAFVIKNLTMGGPRVSLISLLSALVKKENLELDLIVISHVGPLMEAIPQGVNLLDEDLLLHNAIGERKYITSIFGKLFRGILVFLKKIFGYSKVYGFVYKLYANKIKKEYDLVIGYQEGESNDLAVKLHSKKHAIWYHSNFRIYKRYEKNNRLKDLYDLANYIVFVTKDSCTFFVEENNRFEKKTNVIQNLIPTDRIKKLAIEPCENLYSNTTSFKLVSVGRLSEEKGYDRAIEVAKTLKNKGFKFEWLIIGGGHLEDELKRKCNEAMVNDCLIFVGEKRNPYQIICQANLLVLTSHSEAQPLVVLEGLTLGVPFVSTKFASAVEVLDETCGLLVENSTEGLIGGIEKIMVNDLLLNTYSIAAKQYQYDNEPVLREIIAMLE